MAEPTASSIFAQLRVKGIWNMKIKYVILIGLSLVLTAVLVQTFGLIESKEGNSLAGSSPRIHTNKVGLPTTQSDEDIYYAVLMMTKSYLPLLEAFKNRKIAKDIKILPAEIEWNDGKIVAISLQSISQGGRRQSDPVRSVSEQEINLDQTLNAQEDKFLNNFFPLLILQGVVESMVSYNPGR